MATSFSEYWKKRMLEILAYVDRTDLDFFSELDEIYKDYYQQTTKEIYAFYQKYAQDNQISLQEAQQRLMKEDLSDYRTNAKKYLKQAEKDPELLKRLNEQYTAGRATRLEALNLEIDWLMGSLNGQLRKSFYGYLKDTASYVFRKVRFGNSASTISTHVLDQIVKTPWKGRNYSEQIWGNTDNLGKDIRDAFVKGFIKGMGPADIARELRKKYNVTRAQAETLVQTDGTNVINNATLRRFTEAGLTKYQFWAHLDNRTTQTCRDHHLKIYDIKDYEPGTNAPPLHYRCRSTILPDDDELGMEKDWQEKAKQHNEEYAARKEKKAQDADDLKEYNKYVKVLGSHAPSLDSFKEMKYNDSEKWIELKESYTNANWNKANFSKERLLNSHFKKHSIEFENISKEEYLRQAQHLLSQPVSERILGYDTETGRRVRYDVAKNTFAAGSDNKIRTFFKPNDREGYFYDNYKKDYPD